MGKWIKVTDATTEYINLDLVNSVERSGDATREKAVIFHGMRFASVQYDKTDDKNPLQAQAKSVIAAIDAYIKSRL